MDDGRGKAVATGVESARLARETFSWNTCRGLVYVGLPG